MSEEQEELPMQKPTIRVVKAALAFARGQRTPARKMTEMGGAM
jgi:hypothetical protein